MIIIGKNSVEVTTASIHRMGEQRLDASSGTRQTAKFYVPPILLNKSDGIMDRQGKKTDLTIKIAASQSMVQNLALMASISI